MYAKRLRRRQVQAEKLTPKPVLLPSGKWRCRVMVNGERRSVTADTPQEANAEALALKEGLLKIYKSPDKMTVGDAIDRYIESKDAVLSPSTILGYKRLRKNAMQDIMAVPLRRLTQQQVQLSINKMAKKSSPKYVANAHGLLSASLAVFLPDMVLRTTLPQKRKPSISIPSEDEIKKLLAAAKGSSVELPILLALWLGLRRSEILGLRWDSIVSDNVLHIKTAIVESEDGPTVKGTKSFSGNRRIRCPKYIMDLIKAQPRNGDFIIHLSGAQIYERFQSVCEEAGIHHLRFHDLRHANASIMLALGVPDKYAMERMGHATNNMLKTIYQHTMTEKQEEVADAVDEYFGQFWT